MSPWREGWLAGRAMSLRRLQWWVAHEWDGTSEHLDARLATQMVAVQYDRERKVEVAQSDGQAQVGPR